MSQFIAMNRFKIVPGMESEFEGIWKTRNTYLEDVPGFIRFNLVKGPQREDHVLYASHTLWASEQDFEAWTKSEAFRKSRSASSQNLYLEHPTLKTFTIVEGASVG